MKLGFVLIRLELMVDHLGISCGYSVLVLATHPREILLQVVGKRTIRILDFG